MTDNKAFKLRPGEQDDFERGSKLTYMSVEAGAAYHLLISQPSGKFTDGFIPPDYLIDGLLQRRFCYSLTAPTGAGKTAIALLLAALVALGRSVGNRQVTPGRVLYFAGENPDDVRMRWIAMAEHIGFETQAIGVRFVAGSFKLADLNTRIRQEVELLGGAELVIIDTSAAFFGGSEENSNVEMGAYARIIRGLTELEGGPTVIALCHPPKGATNDNLQPRGGGAFVAEVDGNLVCIKNDFLVTLHWQVKFRGPDFEPLAFELCPVTAGVLKDSEGRFIPTIIVKLADEKRQEAIETKTRDDQGAVLIAI